MAYWYIAHEDELLLDLDDYTRPTRTGCPWGESFFRRRLRDAITWNKLSIDGVWLARSRSPKHFHAVVKLAVPMGVIERLVWQMHLGSDLYRGRADLMRAALKIDAPSLLIRTEPIPEFYRHSDYACDCTEKHDTQTQFDLGKRACPIWQDIRGLSPWQLFGKSRKLNETFIPLPIGKVPISLIMECDNCDGVPEIP